jgi:hypothetical protein
MSQRGPVSRPASPLPARSPTYGHRNSPAIQQTGLRGGGDPSSEDGSPTSSSVLSKEGERSQLQRSLGVPNILNPTDPRSFPTSAGSHLTQQQHPTGHGGPAASALNDPYESSPAPQRPYVHSTPGSVRPSGDILGSVEASAGRRSPGSYPPWPALGTLSRRYLTPRSPRASSLGHIPTSRPMNPQQPPFPGPVAPVQTRPLTRESSADRSPGLPLAPGFSGLGLPGVSPPGSIPRLTTPPSSQPGLGHAIPSAPDQPIQHHRAASQPQRSSVFPSPSPYSASLPSAGRNFPPLPPGDPVWSPTIGAQQGPRGGAISDEPSTMMFAAPGGEAIPVLIDRTNGSRQADERRLRNAGASARFRQRKKDKDMHRDTMIQKLQSENRELEKRIRELENESEGYRTDRDRLREVVRRTPGISELAYQGPRSPSARSAGSFAERSPLGSIPAPPALPATTYGSDSDTTERPSKWRRVDAQLDYTTGSYSTTLPQPLGYNAPISRPGTPSTSGLTERLPPLRLDQPPSGAPTASEPTPTTKTPAQSYSPYRHPYEAGWATHPGGPPSDQMQH